MSKNLNGIGFSQENHNLDPLSKCHLFETLISIHYALQVRSIPSRRMAEGQGRTEEAARITIGLCRSHLGSSGHQAPPFPGVTHGLGTCPENATCLSGWSLPHASPGRLPEAPEQGKPRTVTQVRGCRIGREGYSPGQIVAPPPQTPGAWLVKGQEREHGCRDRGLSLPSVSMAMPLLAKGKPSSQTGIEAVSG